MPVLLSPNDLEVPGSFLAFLFFLLLILLFLLLLLLPLGEDGQEDLTGKGVTLAIVDTEGSIVYYDLCPGLLSRP